MEGKPAHSLPSIGRRDPRCKAAPPLRGTEHEQALSTKSKDVGKSLYRWASIPVFGEPAAAHKQLEALQRNYDSLSGVTARLQKESAEARESCL
jgi:hypothetical protein